MYVPGSKRGISRCLYFKLSTLIKKIIIGDKVTFLKSIDNDHIVVDGIITSEKVFKIILVQGLNRQIRRMCEYLNYEVIKLKRTRIMNVELGNLQLGDWRELTENELSEIQKMIATSSKTEEASVEENPKKSTKPKMKLTSLKDDFNKKSSVFRKSSPKNKKNNSGFSSKSKRRF